MEILKSIFNFNDYSRFLIITLGNAFRGDDGVGEFIAERLKSVPANVRVIDAGINPENIMDEAVNFLPEKTVVIDASDFNGKPGEVRIIPEENINETSLSTHTFPIRIITELLKHDTGSEVVFLGIQAKNMPFIRGLSPDVENAAVEIIHFINKS